MLNVCIYIYIYLRVRIFVLLTRLLPWLASISHKIVYVANTVNSRDWLELELEMKFVRDQKRVILQRELTEKRRHGAFSRREKRTVFSFFLSVSLLPCTRHKTFINSTRLSLPSYRARRGTSLLKN